MAAPFKKQALKIFLSGATELRKEIYALRNVFTRMSEVENFPYNITLLIWEEVNVQQIKNDISLDADMAIFLFGNKAGRFALEEFYMARSNFQKKGRPLIYVYLLDSKDVKSEIDDSLNSFKEMLLSNAFFYATFTDTSDLETKILEQINRYTIQTENWEQFVNDEKKNKTGKLDLSACTLTEIPTQLSSLTWLTELNLSNNNITSINNLSSLGNLKKLDLYRNKIEKIEGLENNTALNWLGLSSNKIKRIENISHLVNLEKLYIGHNELSEITGISDLPKLNRTILTGNKITSIRPLLPRIQKGSRVLFKYSFKEDEIGFFIKDNPVSEPSKEVIESGNKAIIKYFEDSKLYGKEKLEIIKFVLVGNSRVGKTNFSEFLRTGKITENNTSTHLLDIKPWKANFLKSEIGSLTQLQIFDFGGQDYYHDSHKMYYSHDTAYILLWDQESNQYAEKEENPEGIDETIIYENFPIDYWLESINYNLQNKYSSTYANEGAPLSLQLPPIFVIQNKIDQGEGFLNQATLSGKYQNIWGFYGISLRQQKRTEYLKKMLSEYFYALNLSGRQLVLYQMQIIRHYIESVEDMRVISLKDFHLECAGLIAQPNIKFELADAQIIAQILNNTGILLYDKIGEEDGTIYTNIKVLNKTIKKIMDIAKKGNDKGIFKRDQVTKIKHHEIILALLTKNNSMISISNDEFLVPQFLPTKPDKSIEFFLSAFQYKQLRFVYRAYFHKSLLLNLFAEYLKDTNINTALGVQSFPFWRNGIIISRGDGASKQMVFVEFVKDKTCGMINIWTMKPFDKNGLERKIEQSLDRLNKGWTVDKEISVDSSTYFNLEELTMQADQNQFEYAKDGKKFGINDFKHITEFANLPKRLFLSYSSRNSDFVRRFVTHLEVLKASGDIDPWYDRMIEPGTRWDDTIKAELQKADVVIFLLSPDFIATKYVFDVEIPQAIQQVKAGKTKLFFVELQPCSWEKTIIKDYQQTDDVLQPDKNIISLGQSTNDAGWKKVVGRLESLLK